MSQPNTRLPNSKQSYWILIVGYFGLLSLMTAWITILAPPEKLPIALLLILCVVPLLFPLRGLLHGRPRSANWASYLALPYFIHGVMEAYSNPELRWLGSLEILMSLWLITGAGLYLYATKPRP